jgi:hypothetical protein
MVDVDEVDTRTIFVSTCMARLAISPQFRHPCRRNENRQIHRMSQKFRPGIHFVNIDHDARTEEDCIV